MSSGYTSRHHYHADPHPLYATPHYGYGPHASHPRHRHRHYHRRSKGPFLNLNDKIMDHPEFWHGVTYSQISALVAKHKREQQAAAVNAHLNTLSTEHLSSLARNVGSHH